MPIVCPHCQAENAENHNFCERCGKALPAAAGTPRVVAGAASPGTTLGRSFKQRELKDAMRKKAAGTLLAVTILQVLGSAITVALQGDALEPAEWRFMVAIMLGIAGLFFALYLWARKNPLPAAITGLVVFVTLHALDAVADPASIPRGLLMKVIVLVLLISAIKAGLQYRQMVAEHGDLTLPPAR